MNRLKSGMKPLLWSAAAVVLLVSVIVPALNMLTVGLIMVPFVVMYSTLSRQAFALHVIAVFVVAFLIFGASMLILGLFFLPPSIVMGYMYRKKAQARTVITVVTLTFLAEFLLQMLFFSAMGISLTGEMSNLVRTVFTDLGTQGMLPESWNGELTETLIRTMVQTIPLVLIVLSFLLAVIGHWVARNTLNRWHGLEIPGLKPAKDWMMPKILVLYYLIALVFDLVISKESDTFFNTVLINLIPLLRWVFTIQAIGFFFYLADQKRWNRVVPVLLSVPVFLFPPLSLIGVLDVAFPIRKSFKR
ncbi:DUF2232 domain-containing protein [Paenibacillus tarimensis]